MFQIQIIYFSYPISQISVRVATPYFLFAANIAVHCDVKLVDQASPHKI